MEEKLRVTLVATGLGNQVTSSPAKVALVEPAIAPVENEIEIHEFTTQQAALKPEDVNDNNLANDGSYNEDLLDIPAFLRKQAD